MYEMTGNQNYLAASNQNISAPVYQQEAPQKFQQAWQGEYENAAPYQQQAYYEQSPLQQGPLPSHLPATSFQPPYQPYYEVEQQPPAVSQPQPQYGNSNYFNNQPSAQSSQRSQPPIAHANGLYQQLQQRHSQKAQSPSLHPPPQNFQLQNQQQFAPPQYSQQHMQHQQQQPYLQQHTQQLPPPQQYAQQPPQPLQQQQQPPPPLQQRLQQQPPPPQQQQQQPPPPQQQQQQPPPPQQQQQHPPPPPPQQQPQPSPQEQQPPPPPPQQQHQPPKGKRLYDSMQASSVERNLDQPPLSPPRQISGGHQSDSNKIVSSNKNANRNSNTNAPKVIGKSQTAQKKKKTKKNQRVKSNAHKGPLLPNPDPSLLQNVHQPFKQRQNDYLPPFDEADGLRNAAHAHGPSDSRQDFERDSLGDNLQYDGRRRKDDYIQREALLPPDEISDNGNVNRNRNKGLGNFMPQDDLPRSYNPSYDDPLPRDTVAYDRQLPRRESELERNFRPHPYAGNEDAVYDDRRSLRDDRNEGDFENNGHNRVQRDHWPEQRIDDNGRKVSNSELDDHRDYRFDDRRPVNRHHVEGVYERARSLSRDRDFDRRGLIDEVKRQNGDFFNLASDRNFDERRQEEERLRIEGRQGGHQAFDEQRRFNDEGRGPHRSFEDDRRFEEDLRFKQERERHLNETRDRARHDVERLDRARFEGNERNEFRDLRDYDRLPIDDERRDLRDLERRRIEENDLRRDFNQRRREEEDIIRNRRPSQDVRDIRDSGRDIRDDRDLRRSQDFRDHEDDRRSQDIWDDRSRRIHDNGRGGDRRGSQDIRDEHRRSQDNIRIRRRNSPDIRDDRRRSQDVRDDRRQRSQDRSRDDRRSVQQEERRPRIFLRDSVPRGSTNKPLIIPNFNKEKGPLFPNGPSSVGKDRDRDRDRSRDRNQDRDRHRDRDRDRDCPIRGPLDKSKREKAFPVQPWTHQKTQPKYKCEDCGALFLLWIKCLQHLKEKKHCGMPGGSMKGLQQKLGNEDLLKSSKTKFICYDCNLEFSHWDDIANHVRKLGHCQEQFKSKTIKSKTDVLERLSKADGTSTVMGRISGGEKMSVIQRLAPSTEKSGSKRGERM